MTAPAWAIGKRAVVYLIIITIFVLCNAFREHDYTAQSDLGGGGVPKTEQSFARHWPEMKQRLCPNMVPKSFEYGQTLFELARIELGAAPDSVSARGEVDRKFVRSFFEFEIGTTVYTSPDRRHHTIYQSIWKCGNVHIGTNLARILPLLGESMVSVAGLHEVLPLLPNASRTTNDTCLVTAVRDPVGHFLSGYNECEFRNSLAYGSRRRPPRRWEWSGRDHPDLFTRHAAGTDARFEDFVDNFVGGPSRVGIDLALTELMHVFSMSGFLKRLDKMRRCLGTDLSLAGYLPSLDDLNVAFPRFLRETCPGASRIDAFEGEGEKMHPTSSDPLGTYSAAKRVWQVGNHTSRALCAIHAIDYACFDAVPVPRACQEVFGREGFREALYAQNRTATGREHNCKFWPKGAGQLW